MGKYTKVFESWTGRGKYDKEISSLKPSDNAFHINLNEKNNFEWWYFDARLDNGYTIIFFFHARNHLTKRTEIEITIYKPNGEKMHKFFPYDPFEFKASRKIPDIRLGDNYLEVDYTASDYPVYNIYIEEEGICLNLKFSGQIYGWQPGEGYTKFGKKGFFAWIIPLPKAKVTGNVKIDEEEMVINGVGYHDHNWGEKIDLSRYISHWLWGRIYSETMTVIYAIIQLTKRFNSHKIKVLMFADNDKIKLSTGEFKIEEENLIFEQKTNNYYNKILKIELPDVLKTKLNVEKIIDSENLLSNLKPILRFFAKNLLNLKPGYFRFQSNFTIEYIHEKNEIKKESGKTLHEMVILR